MQSIDTNNNASLPTLVSKQTHASINKSQREFLVENESTNTLVSSMDLKTKISMAERVKKIN